MVFVDRVSGQPNRYALTTEDGNKYYVTLERADNPITEGTPLNAETFNDMTYEFQGLIDRFDRKYDAAVATLNNWVNKKDLLYVESADHPGCYYRIVDGETEWVNPPLVNIIEYRTTERWLGKPVYVRYLDTPAGGGTGTNSIQISLFDDMDRNTLRLESYIYNPSTGEKKLFPLVSNGSVVGTLGVNSDGYIEAKITGDSFANWVIQVLVKYTKS